MLRVGIERLQYGSSLRFHDGNAGVFPRKLMNRVHGIPERQDQHFDLVCDASAQKHRSPMPIDSLKIGQHLPAKVGDV